MALRTELLGGAPDDLAVRHEGKALSYAELAERAGALAVLLQAGGALPGSTVAVALTDRLDVVTALVGVLAAGCCYLPLDPAAPRQHREGVLARQPGALVLDRLDQVRGPEKVDRHAAGIAYLLHTSGTTGKPKGVAVSREALRGHVAAIAARFGLTSQDRVLQFSAPHVDVAIEQVLATLSVGAALVLRGTEVPSFAALADLVRRNAVTVANLPAGYANEFAARLGEQAQAGLASLRLVVSGSDRLSPSAARAWLRHLPGVALVNAYGPTESVITATTYPVSLPDLDDARGRGDVPIGRPVGDRAAYVLDEALCPVQDGTPGELYLGGLLLAIGYHGDPAATADRFLPDPFSSVAGGRMYRTGDRVIRSEDGMLRFLGRVDEQVKIRGFRVEPGEIRHVLQQHPAVRTCAVDARDDGAGRTVLVGYAVAPQAGPDELREYLAATLPAHLVPLAVVLLAELPLTRDGKVDHAALPAPRLESRADREAPRTPTEWLLATIWADMLAVEEVGRADNFFALGGDSLAALRLTAELMQRFGPSVDPQAVFGAPTLTALAATLDELTASDAPDPVTVPVAESVAGEVPLSFAQESLWFLDRWAPGTSTYTVPWAFRLTGPVDLPLLRSCLVAIVDRHPALRTTFAERFGEPRQVVHERLDVPLTVHDLRGAEESEGQQLVAEIVSRPFDLAAGPLVRTELVRLAENVADLVLVCHHTVWDEGSLAVLERELGELYRAGVAGREADLPALPTTYAEYAAAQRGRFAGSAGHPALDYWATRLVGAPAELDLPLDRPRPAELDHRVRRCPSHCPTACWTGFAGWPVPRAPPPTSPCSPRSRSCCVLAPASRTWWSGLRWPAGTGRN